MIKRELKRIDSAVFNGKIRKLFLKFKAKKNYFFLERPAKEHRSDDLSSAFEINFKKNDFSNLNVLCDKYGSDKGEVNSNDNPYRWPSHNYADFYEMIFRLRKDDVRLVIECGIGTNNPNLESSMGIDGKPGASLRVWHDYFPNANIIGVDIDNDILFSDERITTYYCDQTSQDSIKNFVKTAGLEESSADVIIDDGLHIFEAGKSFFEGLISYLSPNGIYIIEDISVSDIKLHKDYFLSLSKNYSVKFVSLSSPLQKGGNNKIVVIWKND